MSTDIPLIIKQKVPLASQQRGLNTLLMFHPKNLKIIFYKNIPPYSLIIFY